MNRKNFTVMLVVLCISTTVVAQSTEGKAVQSIPELVSRVTGAMVRLEFVIDSRIVPPQRHSGQCVCIDASKRLFLTRDLVGGIPEGELRDFVIVTAGIGGKRIKAEFVGMDYETGLSFVRATEKHNFSEVRFARTSNLRLGRRVLSVGLLGPQTGNTPYLGTGVVSSVVRLPHQVVYVSGGELTNSSSPVFTDDGRAIGLIAGQLPMEYRMMAQGRWADVGLAGQQAGKFFMPVEEFIGALSEPVGAKKLPWAGFVKFYPVNPEQAETITNLGGATAVLVGQVIPDSPAAKVGIKQADAIVAFEGVPLEKLATPDLTVTQLTKQLLRRKVGSKVSLTLLRKGERQTVQVELVAMPTQPNEAPHYYNKPLGIVARDMVIWDRYIGLEKPLMEKGTIITMVRRDSPAAKGQLKPGDFITAINDVAAPSTTAMGSILDTLAKAGSTKPINFIVKRGDKPEVLVVNPE
ncbi:MAG: PDZ domain-containing protein [Planctomycetota bacterium]|nr:PDZ domain-containing protein [Planctomycetota bacterium]